ncbi:MAG: glutamate synthase large subunit [Puniceicoccaceae bacterium]|nr:MAG: glutamate synthase large subunit [Puniceicoccaceae bacterium]
MTRPATVLPSPLHRWEFEHDACGIGLIANLHGKASHDLLARAITALKRLAHRGAIDADAITGDGAGVLTQLPIALLREHLEGRKKALFADRDLGVGMVFLPRDDDYAQAHGKRIIEEAVRAEGLAFLDWRTVPVDSSCLGRKAEETQPLILQALVARKDDIEDDAFERKLYLAQKVSERRATEAGIEGFYICSFSSRTIVYKGLLNSPQIRRYFLDLRSPLYTTAFVIFHQRYSTNTFPTWHLAQPFRMMAHNGEINTIRGNRNLMRARERSTAYGVWGERFADLRPLVQPDMSDSASFDNALQAITLGGRSPLNACAMMMPPAWEKDELMDPGLRAFYRYHACLLEPWDGPAAIAFSDGRYVAAALDRNGLRPARYKLYDDGTFVLASEAGLIPEDGLKILSSGRLGPGRMVAIDLVEHRFLSDEDIKSGFAAESRFRQWCDDHLTCLHAISVGGTRQESSSTGDIARPRDLQRPQVAFGFEEDEFEAVLRPMAENAGEPTASMGDDTPLAVLSRRPRLLYTYFKQLFAQVTNPAIDSIRERSVMSLNMILGGRLGLFEDLPASTGLVEIESPLLFDEELADLFSIKALGGRVQRLSVCFDQKAGPEGLEAAVKALAKRSAEVVESGAAKIIVLSDLQVGPDQAAIPMLLATGAVHQQLVRSGLRLRCDIVCETGEARDVHQIATLLGYGANAVNPWLALALIREKAGEEAFGPEITPEKARANYRKAIENGLLKIMAKMGISTLFSYRAAQIFEAIGLGHKLVEECFYGTPTPVGGISYEHLGEELFRRHGLAYGTEGPAELSREGYLRIFRRGGEFHAWNPQLVAGLHRFVHSGTPGDYDHYLNFGNQHPPAGIKDLLRFRFTRPEVNLEEVEPIEDIRRRFTTAGMSLGALSPEVHEVLAIAMNRIGGKSNSGEGGEDPRRYSLLENGDNANSAIKQVASGRFGVTAEYLASAKEIEIKVAQGAKPGEGGQLPGHKVSPLIARLRYSVPGVTLISPPPHHDIYSIEDLAQLIFDLKEVNPRAKVCVKLVSCSGVGTVAAGVAKAYADVILISGHEGGTGASPLSSIKHAGSAWEIGVAEAHQVLMMNGLRNRVVLRTDGGMKTGRDIVIAAILGAEEFNFGTAALIAAGCAMFRVCHLNTCPVGVATQRDDLRAKFSGKPEYVINFFNAVAEDVRRLVAKLGYREINDIIGRTELLEQVDDPTNPKTRHLNLSGLLHNPDPSGELDRYHTRERNERFGFEGGLDEAILQEAKDVINGKSARLVARYKVGNADRCIGTQLSGEIAYLRGDHALPPGTIDLTFTGSAGQSFGTFLVDGIRLKLIGEANDYVGKGMAGGEIIIRPKPSVTYAWHENTIIGNTCLYGATGGLLLAAGRAGERFCVRNSGAIAVVEGVGDHGCEYMTRGTAVILGRTGRNFGAGMSGGLAFVYDQDEAFEQRVNPAMVGLHRLNDEEEIDALRRLIEAHARLTESPHAARLLEDWAASISRFWKVLPYPPTKDTPEVVLRTTDVPAVLAPA